MTGFLKVDTKLFLLITFRLFRLFQACTSRKKLNVILLMCTLRLHGCMTRMTPIHSDKGGDNNEYPLTHTTK